MHAISNNGQQSPLKKRHESLPEGRQANVDDLLARYDALADSEHEEATELRLEILRELSQAPALLTERRYSRFLSRALEPDDLRQLDWESPDQMMLFGEALYGARWDDEQLSAGLTEHTRTLMRHGLAKLEREGNMEELFRLLRLAPSDLLYKDNELSRLRYRANAYEIRRVQRNRRTLYSYLIVQVLLVLFVFPFLFINAENGRLQQQVELLADVELGDDGYQLVSYSEGLYWAVITAASIGYGDITPTTTTGRIIAGALGTMGVITVGILAGLVLDKITPRRIM